MEPKTIILDSFYEMKEKVDTFEGKILKYVSG